jgi:hypothetical protein
MRKDRREQLSGVLAKYATLDREEFLDSLNQDFAHVLKITPVQTLVREGCHALLALSLLERSATGFERPTRQQTSR